MSPDERDDEAVGLPPGDDESDGGATQAQVPGTGEGDAPPPLPPGGPAGPPAYGGTGGVDGPAARPGLPWERPQGRSLRAAIDTIRLVLLQPAEAFAMMRRDGSLGDPLLFLVLFGTLGAFFGLLWQSTMRTFWGRFADVDMAELAVLNSFGIISLLMAPVFVLLFAALSALLVHVALMAFGGAPQPLDVTLRTVSYSAGATYLFTIIPFCGGIVSAIWWIVVMSIGIREAHEVPGGRAVAAVLVPIVVICCCCALIPLMFSAAILSAAGLN